VLASSSSSSSSSSCSSWLGMIACRLVWVGSAVARAFVWLSLPWVSGTQAPKQGSGVPVVSLVLLGCAATQMVCSR
jgi:hypothetical protein